MGEKSARAPVSPGVKLMNNEKQKSATEKGEILFRVCAYALTGLQCTLYVLILILLFCLLFYVAGLLSKGESLYSSETGFTVHGIIQVALFLGFLLIPNIIGWFIAFLYPLKSKSQTWGMKMFGLKAINQKEKNLTWKSAFLQEGVQTITCGVLIGVFGLILALFKDDEKTFFNRISGISIIQDHARLKFVEEFREYRRNNV